MIKIESQAQTKPHFVSSSDPDISQVEGRSPSTHNSIPMAQLASYKGTVLAKHVPCWAFTRYPWQMWGSVAKFLSLPTSEMGKCFCNTFWNPCIKATFKSSSFQQHFGKITGNNLTKITTWASIVTFPVDFNRKPPVALDKVLPIFLYQGTRQKDQRLCHYTCCQVGPWNSFDPTPLIWFSGLLLQGREVIPGRLQWSLNSKWLLQSQI